MALTVTRQQMRDSIRRFANVQGTTALLRHPDVDLNDYINRALGSLHRRLTAAMPDQRLLASTTVATEAGVTTYALPAGFDFLIGIEMTADGTRSALYAYEMAERAELLSPDLQTTGIPVTYRLRAGNIEFLPTPSAAYSILIWYVPAASQLTADAQTYDTISRLDDYVIAYGARLIAIKDKNWDLVNAACKPMLDELIPEIEALARNRDRASPPRITDTRSIDAWGRSSGRRRGYR